jgi:hypothetical protein
VNEATATISKGKKAPITTNSIVKRVPRVDPNKDRKDRALAGDYRVIHGKVLVPRPVEAFLNADGTERPLEAKYEEAIEGDVLRLTDVDAARLMDAGVIETLDAKPSRVGQGFKPPPVVWDFTGMPAGARQQATQYR